MTRDLSKKTLITGRDLDEIGVTKFEFQNGDLSTFNYGGQRYTVQRLNVNNERYKVLEKTPIESAQSMF